MNDARILSIVEMGGYPDFTTLYQSLGYKVTIEHSMRQALKQLKKQTPEIVVAEFNFQSDFRDRTSSLETLMSVIERKPSIKTIIFYDQQFTQQFSRLQTRFTFDKTLTFPVSEAELKAAVCEK